MSFTTEELVIGAGLYGAYCLWNNNNNNTANPQPNSNSNPNLPGQITPPVVVPPPISEKETTTDCHRNDMATAKAIHRARLILHGRGIPTADPAPGEFLADYYANLLSKLKNSWRDDAPEPTIERTTLIPGARLQTRANLDYMKDGMKKRPEKDV